MAQGAPAFFWNLPMVLDIPDEEQGTENKSEVSRDAPALGPQAPTKESGDRLERQTFERQQVCEVFRNATSAKELEFAIAKATELGLTHEATLGKRKLDKFLKDSSE